MGNVCSRGDIKVLAMGPKELKYNYFNREMFTLGGLTDPGEITSSGEKNDSAEMSALGETIGPGEMSGPGEISGPG